MNKGLTKGSWSLTIQSKIVTIVFQWDTGPYKSESNLKDWETGKIMESREIKTQKNRKSLSKTATEANFISVLSSHFPNSS